MEKVIIVNSLKDTREFSKEFAKEIKNGDVILLNGEIGAGKTTFTKFLLENLGVKSIVSSPTFTLLNEYEGEFPIYHFDMYRISTPEELYELGFEDFLNSKNSPYVKTGLTIVEWGENVKEILPKDAIVVNIEKLGENSRKFKIKRY